MIKLGLCGLGKWGKNYFSTSAGLTNARISAICYKSYPREIDETESFLYTNEYNEVCESDVDAIIIATPASTHYEICKRALTCGKHVLCEKPFTATVGEADELTELAKKNHLNLLVNYIDLFNEGYKYIKKTITGIRYIEYAIGNFGPVREDCNALYDYGSHPIAVCCDLMGYPSIHEVRGNDDHVVVKLRWDKAKAYVFATRKRMHKVRHLDVWGVDSHASYDMASGKLWSNGLKDFEEVKIDQTLPLTNALQSFVDAVKSKEVVYNGDLAVMVTKILCECQQKLDQTNI